MSYKWKINGIMKADPEQVGKELERLGDNISTKEVVQLAKNESSALHNLFEWNNDVAAEKYRIIQAQKIIRNIVFEDRTEKHGTEIRVMFSSGEHDGVYHPAKVVFTNKTAYEDLLQRALAELQAFKKKYECLTELSEILSLIE